jgi:hypothetical protein
MNADLDGSGSKALACAVLEVAYHDLRSTAESKNNLLEAQMFCLSTEGGWAKSRKFWCELAGMEESVYVAAAQRVANTTVV